MKTISTFFLGALLFSASAFAQIDQVNCDSIRGTNRSLTLIIVNQDVKQIRPLNSRRALVPQRLMNQNIPNTTLYSIIGLPSLLQVENKVLQGNGGLMRLAGDEFSCF